MRLSRRSAILLRLAVGVALAFIYVPLIVIAIYAFNGDNTLGWPPTHLTFHWFGTAFHDHGARAAFANSIKAAVVATTIGTVANADASGRLLVTFAKTTLPMNWVLETSWGVM